MTRKAKKESEWPELEEALYLSDNLQEECEEQDRKFDGQMMALIGLIGPGVERRITLANNCLHLAGTLVPPTGTDGPTVTDIRTRKVKVWVWGHINYQDLYGKSHSQQFCGVYIWDWNTFIPNECPAGTNTVDSDPE